MIYSSEGRGTACFFLVSRDDLKVVCSQTSPGLERTYLRLFSANKGGFHPIILFLNVGMLGILEEKAGISLPVLPSMGYNGTQFSSSIVV